MKPEEIKKVAKQVFAKVPDAKKAYITSDGQGFASKNMADLHKNTNAKKAKLQVYEIDRSALLGTDAPPEETPEKKEAPKNQNSGVKNQKEAAKATPEDRSADDPVKSGAEGTGASEPAADAVTATPEGAAKKSSKNPKKSN